MKQSAAYSLWGPSAQQHKLVGVCIALGVLTLILIKPLQRIIDSCLHLQQCGKLGEQASLMQKSGKLTVRPAGS